MNTINIQIEPFIKEQMSKFNVDWSKICQQAIQNELNRLNRRDNNGSLDSLIDINLSYNNSEISEFDSIPNFPRETYQLFKKVWNDYFVPTYCSSKPPTSQTIKALWHSWYSPFFDEAEWWSDWDEHRERQTIDSVQNSYSREYQYTTVDEQKEFFLEFYDEADSRIDIIYIAFIEFISKFIFCGELISLTGLNPFHFKSVALEHKDNLPESPGIYFVIDKSNIYYIGMSINLQQRWYAHHKQPELGLLSEIKIAYLDCLPKHYLKNIESTLINHFKPKLNILENPLYRKC